MCPSPPCLLTGQPSQPPPSSSGEHWGRLHSAAAYYLQTEAFTATLLAEAARRKQRALHSHPAASEQHSDLAVAKAAAEASAESKSDDEQAGSPAEAMEEVEVDLVWSRQGITSQGSELQRPHMEHLLRHSPLITALSNRLPDGSSMSSSFTAVPSISRREMKVCMCVPLIEFFSLSQR